MARSVDDLETELAMAQQDLIAARAEKSSVEKQLEEFKGNKESAYQKLSIAKKTKEEHVERLKAAKNESKAAMELVLSLTSNLKDAVNEMEAMGLVSSLTSNLKDAVNEMDAAISRKLNAMDAVDTATQVEVAGQVDYEITVSHIRELKHFLVSADQRVWGLKEKIDRINRYNTHLL